MSVYPPMAEFELGEGCLDKFNPLPPKQHEINWQTNVLCMHMQVALETEVTNAPAMKLYERLGFLRSKKLHRYYLSGNSAYRLILYLKHPKGGHGDGGETCDCGHEHEVGDEHEHEYMHHCHHGHEHTGPGGPGGNFDDELYI